MSVSYADPDFTAGSHKKFSLPPAMKKKRFLFVSEPRGQEDGEQGRPGQEPTRLGRMGRPCRPSVGPAAVILQNLIASPLALAYWETDICLKPSGVRTRRL